MTTPANHNKSPRKGGPGTSIGTRIRAMREEAGFTQQELARIMAIKQSGMARWERPTYNGYTIRKLQQIADACGYDVRVTFIPKQE